MSSYNNISIFGTSSDSGKSTITFIVAKILQDLGHSVGVFKAQNVSNNSFVADDGSEIAIAQAFQAWVLGIKSTYHLNPILLKSGKKNQASMIINGVSVGNKDIHSYYKQIDKLKPIVKKSFVALRDKYDIVVCEGAGSPVELNLMDKDLSNIYIAKEFNTKIILVADIQKGGVFASIYGTYKLLPKKLRQNIIGVIINKFCGDIRLFEKGIKIIKKEFNIPVLGVLPFLPFNLGFEDSQSLQNYTQNIDTKIKVAVIKFPFISNYNDLEPLILDKEIKIDFVVDNLSSYDMVILPGSKKTIQDLRWLKKTGLFSQIKELVKNGGRVFGICGGYQMMFESIKDIAGIENKKDTKENGLGFIKDDIIYKKTKILKRQAYNIFGLKIQGYEIRFGIAKKKHFYYNTKSIKGTFVHGVFDNDKLRDKIFGEINNSYNGYKFDKYKRKKIDQFIDKMASYLDIDKIIKGF